MTFTNAINLFHSLIRPIALYCCEIWSHLTHSQMNSLENNKVELYDIMTSSDVGIIQQKYLKYVLGVKLNCSNTATLGEAGEYPLLLYGFVSLLKYWHRTANLPNNVLAKQALVIHNMDIAQSEWLSTVKFLLSCIYMNDHFNNPKLVSTEIFSKLCLKRLKEIIVKQWKLKLANSDKLRFYNYLRLK